MSAKERGYGCPGKPYRPANGTEGEVFMEGWCNRCKRDEAFQADPDNADGCPILGDTLMYDVAAKDYPKEWIYDEDGWGMCTAFEPIGTPERCQHTVDMFE